MSRLPLLENGSPQDAVNQWRPSSDYIELREKLIELIGWKEIVPLFKEYSRLHNK